MNTTEGAAQTYFLSQVARYTNIENGYWMAIDHQVYDLTKFMSRHPGGNVILEMHVGMDATKEFLKVGHDLDKTVLLMMKRYRIGEFVIPEFANKEDQSRYIKWSMTLSLCTEMLNAFTLDISTRNKDLIPDVDTNDTVSPINLRLMSDLLVRFEREYILVLLSKLKECIKDNSLTNDLKLIAEKVERRLQIYDQRKETIQIESSGVIFQRLIDCKVLLQELKEELINMNDLWEQYFDKNTPLDQQRQLNSEQHLVALTKRHFIS